MSYGTFGYDYLYYVTARSAPELNREIFRVIGPRTETWQDGEPMEARHPYEMSVVVDPSGTFHAWLWWRTERR